jgi:mannose-1-phosphate guanylyltransferase/mannose-6-phosphate isomerase
MIVVIVAGGSGTRLWPLSASDYPKHLLDLTGGGTLLRQTFKRAKQVADEVYIISEQSHACHISEQLPDLPASHLFVEPGRRGTANCVLFALDALLRKKLSCEPVTFIHCDHVIKDSSKFVSSIKTAASVAIKNKKIVLCGVIPTYNSIAFGYIEKGENIDGGAYAVKSFKEKPDGRTAAAYIESGNFLWNTGYFTGSVDIFLQAIKNYSPVMQLNFEKLQDIKNINSSDYGDAYLSLESGAIDYLLMEHARDLLVIPASFDWADVGNFRDLYALLPKDADGNALNGKNIFTIDCSNIFVRNDEEKPVAVIALDDIVVINTANGILVTKREHAHKAGDVAKQIKNSHL